MNRRSLHTILTFLCVLPLLAAAPSERDNGDESLKPRFAFIGHWQGYRDNGKKGGTGTVILIAPSWVLTAGHVAKLKAEDADRRGEIHLDSGAKAEAASVFLAPHGDVALVRLDSKVTGVPFAALLDRPLTKEDGDVTFTLAGHSGGLHVHPGRHAHAVSETEVRHETSKDDPSPGRSGDSGGAWAIDKRGDSPIVFAVIHGAGVGAQVGPLREWIEATMSSTHESAKWQAWRK